MTITEFVKGDTLRLLDFGQTPIDYRRRLLSLGITKGVCIVIERFAPLGCPIQVRVRGTSLALRKEDISDLHWERV